MQNVAIAAVAGIAAATAAQTASVDFQVFDATTLAPVDPVAATAGSYFVLATLSFSDIANELTTNSDAHDFGLIGLVAGTAAYSGGVSYGGLFLPGIQFGAPGAAGNANYGGGSDPDGWLVAGPEVLVWNGNNAFTANAAIFQVEFDGTIGTFDFSRFVFEMGLFAGTQTPFGISLDLTDGTAFNQDDFAVTVAGPVTFGIPAPTAAAAFGVAGLAAARRRR